MKRIIFILASLFFYNLSYSQCTFNDPLSLEQEIVPCGPAAYYELHAPDGLITNACPNESVYSAELRYSTFNTQGATDYRFCIELDNNFNVDDSQFTNVTVTPSGLSNQIVCGDISYAGQSSICASYFVKLPSALSPGIINVDMWLILDDDIACTKENFNLSPYIADAYQLNTGSTNFSDPTIIGNLSSTFYLPDNSTIVLDGNGAYTNSPNDIFVLGAGSKFVLPAGNQFTLNKVIIIGCTKMHLGIEVEDQGSLTFKNESLIQDGHQGINVLEGATLEITNSKFQDNKNHIYSSNITSLNKINFVSFSENIFEGTGSLKPSPIGIPNPSIPNAGIYLTRDDHVDVSTSIVKPNHYKNLKTGILITGGAISSISNNLIEDCETGINASGNFAPGTYISDNTINRGDIGIQASSTAANIRENEITGSREGIYLKGLDVNAAIVYKNIIAVKERGINSLYKSAFTEVTENIISFTEDNKDNVGIDLLFSDDFEATNNTVTIGDGDSGINFNTSVGNHFFENTVVMTDPNMNVLGFSLENADDTELDCNLVDGPGDMGFTESTGIYTTLSPSSTLSCNLIEDVEEGLWYEGSSLFTELEGNTFKENKIGIQLSQETINCTASNSVIGIQDHYGNIWDNSPSLPTAASNYTNSVPLVFDSQFRVDTDDNPSTGTLLPTNIELCVIAGWFADQAGVTFSCDTSNPCDGGPGARGNEDSPVSSGMVNYLLNEVVLDENVTLNEAWIMQQQAYSLLKKKLSPSDWTDAESLFVNSFSNTNIHFFTDIDNLLVEVKSDAYSVSQYSEDLLVALGQYEVSKSETTLYNIKEKQDALREAMMDFEVRKNQLLLDIKSELLSIYPENDIETKYKEAYEIYVDFVLSKYDVSLLDKVKLEELANMCVTEYPVSTLIARGLLSIEKNRSWEDATTCDYAKPRNKLNMTDVPLAIIPNPTNHSIKLVGFTGDVTIYNSMGIEVLRGFANKRIDVSTLPNGIYVVSDNFKNAESFIKFN